MTVVFVHGAGRPGADGWPLQAAQPREDYCFLDRHPDGDDAARDARRVLELLGDAGGGHLVATSYGANAAVLTAQAEPDLVRTLALLEPACFDLARGCPAVEKHIDALTPLYALATDPTVSVREFSTRFSAAMGREVPDLPDDVLEVEVARLRRLAPPWDCGVSVSVGLPVPTLVVTGGWSDLYDQTAAAIVGLGAEHVELAGAGHGVHRDPRIDRVLRACWDAPARH